MAAQNGGQQFPCDPVAACVIPREIAQVSGCVVNPHQTRLVTISNQISLQYHTPHATVRASTTGPCAR